MILVITELWYIFSTKQEPLHSSLLNTSQTNYTSRAAIPRNCQSNSYIQRKIDIYIRIERERDFYLLYKKGDLNDIKLRSSFQAVVWDNKSNLLILLSSDRTMPTNTVYLDVMQDVFHLFEFNEINILAHRPSSEPLTSYRYTTVMHARYLYRPNLSTIHLITTDQEIFALWKIDM